MSKKKKVFLLGNSGVGKTTLFQELQSEYSDRFNFVIDESFKLNNETFTQLPMGEQQRGMINYLANRDIQPVEKVTIYDEGILSTLIWSRALLITKQITPDEYYAHKDLVSEKIAKIKQAFVIVLKDDLDTIKENIKKRNRSIEHLDSMFKKVYDVYVEIYYDEIYYLMGCFFSSEFLIIPGFSKRTRGFKEEVKELFIQYNLIKGDKKDVSKQKRTLNSTIKKHSDC